jgi:SAM-dependent methyltransferase
MAARIDDQELIRRDYAEPERLSVRFRPFREYHEPDLQGRLVEVVGAGPHADVLEVGCGEGEFSQLVQRRLGATVHAVDQSEEMVSIARTRGVDAMVGDVQELPFRDGSFDVVVANWMLYHVPDLPHALGEIHRVLRPGGRLVAATMGDGMLHELWSLVPDDGTTPHLGFSAENGADVLAPTFPRVELIDLHGAATFPDREAVLEYIEATLTRGHLASELPEFDGPLRASTSNVAFVAHRSA